MKIVAISDIHGQLPERCPECDLLIIAGDICPDLRPVQAQGEWLNTSFREWLRDQPARKIIGTWGNHDFIGRWSGALPEGLPIVVDELIEFEGKRIFLTPYVPNLRNWAFSFPDDVPFEFRQRIPDNLDILVSHGPPKGYFDQIIEGSHVGSESLLAWCRASEPKVIICGHIHEGRGAEQTSWGGMIYNVSSVDRMYRAYPERYTVICQ